MDFPLHGPSLPTSTVTEVNFATSQAQLKQAWLKVQNTVDQAVAHYGVAWFTAAVRVVNPFEGLKKTPRLSSRAYFKMYEVLRRYGLIERFPPGHYSTLHLCEAPGGFVQATLDYTRSTCPSHTLQWTGVTLPPETNTTTFRSSTPGEPLSWQTPDLDLASDNIIYANVITDPLPDRVNQALLVTGDGGFEIPNYLRYEQETLNDALLAAQLHQAQRALRPGGSMVIKMFSCFEPATCRLLADVSTQFDQMYLLKPMASRIGNTEKYLVAIHKKTEPLAAPHPGFWPRLFHAHQSLVHVQLAALDKALLLLKTHQPSVPLTTFRNLNDAVQQRKAHEALDWLKCPDL